MLQLNFDPVISPWAIFIVALVLLYIYFRHTESWLDFWLASGIVLVLVAAGFQAELTRVTYRFPETPVKIIYENTPRTGRFEYEKIAKKLGQKIASVSSARAKIVPLDERWETPFFRDYNQLKKSLSINDPVQVVVGDGRHTVPLPGPLFGDSSPTYRSLYTPTAYAPEVTVKAVKPIKNLDYPGRTQWSIHLSGVDNLSSPRLVLSAGGEVISEKRITATNSFQKLKLTSPHCEKGVHYFELQLLEAGEGSLPPDHSRKTGLGVVVSDLKKKILVVDRYPRWRSGWWGRQVKEVENWEVAYKYRASGWEETIAEPPDQVLYFGFPADKNQRQELARWIERGVSLLFFADQPKPARQVGETLELLDFDSQRDLLQRTGDFPPQLAPGWLENFSALTRFEGSLKSAPPFRSLLVNLSSGPYHEILKARGEFLFGLYSARPLGFFASSDFYNLSMQWGRFERPEVGGKLARTIIQKLFQMRPRATKKIVARQQVVTGEPLPLNFRKARQLTISGPWKNSYRGPQLPARLYFPRPGKYQLKLRTNRGGVKTASVVVVSPGAERLAPENTYLQGLVRPDNQFTDLPELLKWFKKIWQEQKEKREEIQFKWNNPLVLLLAILLFILLWYRRSRRLI